VRNFTASFFIIWFLGYILISLGLNQFSSPISILLDWSDYDDGIRFALLSGLFIWLTCSYGLSEMFEYRLDDLYKWVQIKLDRKGEK